MADLVTLSEPQASACGPLRAPSTGPRGLKARGSDCVLPKRTELFGRATSRSYMTSLGKTPYGSLLVIIAIEDGKQFGDGQQLPYFLGQVK